MGLFTKVTQKLGLTKVVTAIAKPIEKIQESRDQKLIAQAQANGTLSAQNVGLFTPKATETLKDVGAAAAGVLINKTALGQQVKQNTITQTLKENSWLILLIGGLAAFGIFRLVKK